jgi:hypothetical protein
MPVTKFQGRSVSDKFVEDLLKNTDITKLASSLASTTQQKAEEDRWE